ncbi:MAG: hypothetical protein AAF902_03625 [Chloroflexota bacterium]
MPIFTDLPTLLFILMLSMLTASSIYVAIALSNLLVRPYFDEDVLPFANSRLDVFRILCLQWLNRTEREVVATIQLVDPEDLALYDQYTISFTTTRNFLKSIEHEAKDRFEILTHHINGPLMELEIHCVALQISCLYEWEISGPTGLDWLHTPITERFI